MQSEIERDFYNHVPIVPRQYWKSKSPTMKGLSTDNIEAHEFDADICELCGGKGTYYKRMSRNRKRLTSCTDCISL